MTVLRLGSCEQSTHTCGWSNRCVTVDTKQENEESKEEKNRTELNVQTHFYLNK